MKEQLQQLLKRWEDKGDKYRQQEINCRDTDDEKMEWYYNGSRNTLAECISELKAIIEQTQP